MRVPVIVVWEIRFTVSSAIVPIFTNPGFTFAGRMGRIALGLKTIVSVTTEPFAAEDVKTDVIPFT